MDRSPVSQRSSTSSRACFGRYPFSASGGIVDDLEDLFFALETQTRPIYAMGSSTDPIDGDSVVVHEIAHQWVGDSLAIERWQHIWLNEGFATYAEWLWSEREGLGTVQEIFDDVCAAMPADDPFWTWSSATRARVAIRQRRSTDRGAMTLHALRQEVGDRRLLPDPAPLDNHAGGRERHDRRVHRARRAHLAASSWTDCSTSGCSRRRSRRSRVSEPPERKTAPRQERRRPQLSGI